MKLRLQFRRRPVGFLIAAVTAVAIAVGPATASADHFDPNSEKECGSLNFATGQVTCTLTIAINDEIGIVASEVITVDLDAGTTGATFTAAAHSGGTCAGAVTVTAGANQLQVSPQAPGTLNNCTIIVTEVLEADEPGEVCQTLDSPLNDPPLEVCAQITMPAPPTTKEACRLGGFLTFGIFKNQGDCVSFVATNGKNEPGQNVPNVP